LIDQGSQYIQDGSWTRALEAYQFAFEYKPGNDEAEKGIKFVNVMIQSKDKAKRGLELSSNTGNKAQIKRQDSVIGRKDKVEKYKVKNGEWKIINDDLVIVGIGGGQYLMWPRYKDINRYNWLKATNHAKNLVYKVYNDWRLPTETELMSLYNNGGSLISYEEGRYWTSMEYSADNKCVYFVDFRGSKGHQEKSASLYVRVVRTGQ